MSWQTIITQKKEKVTAPPNDSAKYGKQKAMIAAITQCVELPNVWPLARTWFGKISDINTQITAPCEKAKKAMNIII